MNSLRTTTKTASPAIFARRVVACSCVVEFLRPMGGQIDTSASLPSTPRWLESHNGYQAKAQPGEVSDA